MNLTRSHALARFFASCAMLVFCASMCAAGDFVFVSDGKPASAIRLSGAPSAEETLAADELRTYLRKMSGADVPVLGATSAEATETAHTAAHARTIFITTYERASAAGWRGAARPAPDGFTLDAQANEMWIVGGNPRGALNGVYEVLEMLGVRWFMPGELGEDVPALRRTLKLPYGRRTLRPGYEAVTGLIWAGGAGAESWERRARAHTGSRTAFFGHNWSNIIPATPENKRDHADWFALHKGERIDQLCSTHPDVIRITIERARAFFDANPEALVFSISPNDGDQFCECERCQSLDKSYGATDNNLSDRFVHYANQVLKELGKTHPGKQVGILAYAQHTRPPVSAIPADTYATMICHTPWEFCHAHALEDAACPRNRRFVEYVRGWTRISKNVAVYDYYGHFYVFAAFPIASNISRDIPFLHRLGVRRFTSETQQHWATQGINFYLAAKLLWNPEANPEELMTEYYTRFYGAAAPAMRRYWATFERAMKATTRTGDGGYHWLAMYTPALSEEAARHLAEAERLLAGDRASASERADKLRRRIAFVRSGFRFTEAFARMRHHATQSDVAAMRAAGAEAMQRLDETANSEPQAIWIWLAKSQTEAMMKELEKEIAAAAASEKRK